MKRYRLPKDFGEKWLKALRSGEYRQGRNVLYDEYSDGYCCLGVACRMEYPLHFLKKQNGSFASVINKSIHELKFDLKKIPKEIKGYRSTNNLVNILTDMNDEGISFERIADWIEENVEFYA